MNEANRKKQSSISKSLWTSSPSDWSELEEVVVVAPDNIDYFHNQMQQCRDAAERRLREGDVPLTEEHLSKIVL